MDKYEGLEYVKTDLVKSKGIIYVKFRLASSALRAKEDIEKNNYMVRDSCSRAALEFPPAAYEGASFEIHTSDGRRLLSSHDLCILFGTVVRQTSQGV